MNKSKNVLGMGKLIKSVIIKNLLNIFYRAIIVLLRCKTSKLRKKNVQKLLNIRIIFLN